VKGGTRVDPKEGWTAYFNGEGKKGMGTKFLGKKGI